MAILLITHNLGIVGDMADRVAVMYAGQIVELAPAKELLRRPLHPYTKALMNSVPKLRGDAGRLSAIPGNVPRIGNFPPGCRFAPRCPVAKPECSEKNSRTARSRTRTLGALSVLEMKPEQIHFLLVHLRAAFRTAMHPPRSGCSKYG